LRCTTHISAFLLIVFIARFLEPFGFDFDDRERPMTCEVWRD